MNCRDCGGALQQIGDAVDHTFYCPKCVNGGRGLYGNREIDGDPPGPPDRIFIGGIDYRWGRERIRDNDVEYVRLVVDDDYIAQREGSTPVREIHALGQDVIRRMAGDGVVETAFIEELVEGINTLAADLGYLGVLKIAASSSWRLVDFELEIVEKALVDLARIADDSILGGGVDNQEDHDRFQQIDKMVKKIRERKK